MLAGFSHTLGRRPLAVAATLSFIFSVVPLALAAAAESNAPSKPKGNYERPFEPPTRPAFIPLPPGGRRAA